jgi:hypothetical protein
VDMVFVDEFCVASFVSTQETERMKNDIYSAAVGEAEDGRKWAASF